MAKRRKYLRLSVFLSVLAIAVGILASSTVVAEQVTVTFWDENPESYRTAVYREGIKWFEAENPDIKIKYVPVPWAQSHDKYVIAIAGGVVPDCGGMQGWWAAEFVGMRALMDLEPYIEKWNEKDLIIPSTWESIEHIGGGKRYMIPRDGDGGSILWYRLDWYKEAGMEPPVTTTEFEEQCKYWTNAAENRYGLTMRGARGGHCYGLYFMLTFAQADNIFDEDGNCMFDSAGCVEGLRWYTELYKKGYVPPTAPTDGYPQMIANFSSGVAALLIHSQGSMNVLKTNLGEGNFAAAPLPYGPAGTRSAGPIEVNGFSIFNGAKHPEEAFRWISYLCSERFVSYWGQKTGGFPVHTKVYEHTWAKESPYMAASINTYADPKTMVWQMGDHLPEWGAFCETVWPTNFQSLLLGEKTAKQVAEIWAEFLTRAQKAYLVRNK